ncbi:MAG: hypothetical protein V4727_03705 [Verrucomicrobiota bacterium]
MPKRAPEEFPSKLLRPKTGTLYLSGGSPSIGIELEPFTIDDEEVDQSIDFELEISASGLSDLIGRTFEFPSNPEDGYVEGSIYIWNSHNPIDLHSVAFGQQIQTAIPATLDMTFVFEYEGDRRNLRHQFKLPLSIVKTES